MVEFRDVILLGTALNAVGIVTGTLLGIFLQREMSGPTQRAVRFILGAFTVYAGLQLSVSSLHGSWGQIARQMLVVLLSLIVGKLLGKLLRLQRLSNHLGGIAKRRLTEAVTHGRGDFAQGFTICTILFCAAPLAILGAVQDGLAGQYRILAIKAVVDGLAAWSFARTFGVGILASLVPLVAFQGTITLAMTPLGPLLEAHHLLDSMSAVNGLLVFCVALVILELKRVEIADYLPSLAVAALLGWLF